jgi:ribosomal protein S6--L-glutamate ligase
LPIIGWREWVALPNPKSTRVLEAGDRLLCFGKLERMRELIPAKTRARRHPEVHELDGSSVAPVVAAELGSYELPGREED